MSSTARRSSVLSISTPLLSDSRPTSFELDERPLAGVDAKGAWKRPSPIRLGALLLLACLSFSIISWQGSAVHKVGLGAAEAESVGRYAVASTLPLEERCGDNCTFITPTYIGEQESRAQIHLYQLAVFAQGLGRILVLPNVKHSRFSICYTRAFDFYYAPDALSRLGFETVSTNEFMEWARARKGGPRRTTAQRIVVQNPFTSNGRWTGHPSPMVWTDPHERGYPVSTDCKADELDYDFSPFNPVTFYGTGTGVDQDPTAHHFLANVYASLLSNTLGHLSPFTPPPTVLSFQMSGQHPSFDPPELVALSPSTPLARPFHIYPYSPQLLSLSSSLVTKLSPFIAVQWRTEQVPPANLVPCGRDLIARLRAAKALEPRLATVYLATDYPIESLSDPTLGESHSAGYQIPPEVHAAFRTFREDWDKEGEGLPRLTTWTEEEKAGLEVPEEAKGVMGKGRLRDTDVGLLGVIDKMVATRSELFFAGLEGECGKLSSYMKAIAHAREATLEEAKAGRGEGEKVPGNSVTYFTLPHED